MDNTHTDHKVVYIDENEVQQNNETQQDINETDKLLFGSEVEEVEKVNDVESVSEEKVNDVESFTEENYGGGYESDGMLSDTSSVSTNQILSIDPLYLRLTKFLQTEDGVSVAQTLKDIHKELLNLNNNLSNTRIN